MQASIRSSIRSSIRASIQSSIQPSIRVSNQVFLQSSICHSVSQIPQSFTSTPCSSIGFPSISISTFLPETSCCSLWLYLSLWPLEYSDLFQSFKTIVSELANLGLGNCLLWNQSHSLPFKLPLGPLTLTTGIPPLFLLLYGFLPLGSGRMEDILEFVVAQGLGGVITRDEGLCRRMGSYIACKLHS